MSKKYSYIKKMFEKNRNPKNMLQKLIVYTFAIVSQEKSIAFNYSTVSFLKHCVLGGHFT